MKKRRAILLLEAGFNALYKIVFSTRLLLQLEAHHLITKEIVGGRTSQWASQLAICKKLIAEVSNQKTTETLVISADASNFYDRVAHPFASLNV